MRKIGAGLIFFLALLILGGNAFADCGVKSVGNSESVFGCESEGGFEALAGSQHWIRMSMGFESQAEAIAAKPNVTLQVTMNGTPLSMDGETVVEYNNWGGFWEINSYHCTGSLTPGTYTITGTSYNNGNFVDSASCVMIVLDKSYAPEWWYVQHRKDGTGREFNVSHFGVKDINDNYVQSDVIQSIELFDPDGISIQLSENTGFGGAYKTLYGGYNANNGQWYYGDSFSQENYYRVEFDEPLKTGTYHMKLTDINGDIYDLYKGFNGPLVDLPLISSDSFYAYKDDAGNFYWTWEVPYDVPSDSNTSVRAWVTALTDGVDQGEGEIYLSVPTHMGSAYLPAEVFQKLENVGNSFRMGVHLRTNDNYNRTYSNTVLFDPTNKPPVRGDINDDGKIGLEEAIHALSVTSGLK